MGSESSGLWLEGPGKQTNGSVASVMRSASPALVMRILFALASTGALGGCAATREEGPEEGVTLSKPFEIVRTDSLSPMLAYKFEKLAKIDPANSHAGDTAGQTLSLFGREDLIAVSSGDYGSSGCAPLAPALDVFDEIVRRARLTSIVIVNESHERSNHRGFITELVGRLRPLGYDTLAMEALSNPPAGTPERYLPAIVKQPDLPFLEDEDGFYVSEAGFGRLGRQAKALGYRFLPYELNEEDGLPADASRNDRIAVREEGQARNLASFVREHPGVKLVIHVGYSHAAEVLRPDGAKWMAARVKEKTGIDPLTISQTSCRGGGETMRLSALPSSEPAGTFDLLVDHPTARFTHGRPEWRKQAGDRAVSIPHGLRPTAGWRVIEARPLGEPVTSVPMERVAIRPGEDIALMLPPGRYHLRAIDVTRTDQKRSTTSSQTQK